ncbi:DUF3857 domain-containing protein [Mariniflexile sp. AS56]|uniref:DUF3857 domain-containing protein n=1 Tax=Mariniflexile sp. AS56 TaxID=3063957 RepID=UPI0026EDF98F|nr:DUF3857 domain-containing protein [Mariniflexile sp. AS56]MDO7173050.1 DUF3857 domain-containing protein [Mariniflexile sp. AS56]
MRVITLLLSVCFCMTTFAQNFNFGKVSKEELEEKFNPLDSSANATYLYKYRKTFFEYRPEKGFELVTEIHERVKIYNQEGFDYATKTVNLGKRGSDDEEFSSLKAYTYNLVEGKIEEDKIGRDGVFESELHKYANQVKFTMPNIKSGSVVEYKYSVTSPFVSNIDDFVFQHNIPVKQIDFKFEVPEYFNFKLNTKGFLPVVPVSETKRDKISFTNKERTGGGTNSKAAVTTSYSTSDVEFTKSITTYNLENIPALKDEPYVNAINNYRSSVKYELSYTKFPNSSATYYSTTWEDVVDKIYKSNNFGDELDKTGYFETEVDALIGSVSDPARRAMLIFDFVKSRVNWNGYYGFYTNDGVKKAYKDQVGNVGEINLMLTSMLRYAGLKVYPVLISTREHGVPLFPTREGYNYVVAYVKLAGGGFLLDATNKFSVPNVLPFRTLNWQGRIISEHGGSELIDLYPNEISKNTVSFMAVLDNNGNLNGNYRSVKTNHEALLYREKYNNVNKEDFLEKLENKYNGIEISDFKVVNDLDLSKPIIESYKFSKESQADIIGDKLYFSPFFFLKENENPFKLENREFPVDFGYASTTSHRMLIKIPDGYKVESLPEPAVLMMPDNLGVFKFNINNEGASIQLVVDSQVNQPIISALHYQALKEYFSKIIELEAQQIVLTKV